MQVLILGPLLVYVEWVHWLQEVLREVGLGLEVLQGKLSFQLVL